MIPRQAPRTVALDMSVSVETAEREWYDIAETCTNPRKVEAYRIRYEKLREREEKGLTGPIAPVTYVADRDAEPSIAPSGSPQPLAAVRHARVGALALSDVLAERVAQIEKWGEQTHDPMTWLVILGEEVGEASEAALHDRFGGPKGGTFRREMIQAAAVALQIVEAIDRGDFQ